MWFRSNDVTSGHLRSRDIVSCHVTTSSCELQPCMKSNAQFTPVFGLLQPLPGDFRSNDVTFGSLPLCWSHATSFPVTWLPPASYCLVWIQTHSVPQFSAFTSPSRWLPVKWRHFEVTFAQLRSLDAISSLQPLPGDFRSNDVTSGSLPVTWGHVTSFPVMWRFPPASYSLVKSQTHSIRQFRPSPPTSRWLSVKERHFRVTSSHLRSPDVISCHVTTSSCELQPCRKSNAQYTPVSGLLQPLPGDFRSKDVT